MDAHRRAGPRRRADRQRAIGQHRRLRRQGHAVRGLRPGRGRQPPQHRVDPAARRPQGRDRPALHAAGQQRISALAGQRRRRGPPGGDQRHRGMVDGAECGHARQHRLDLRAQPRPGAGGHDAHLLCLRPAARLPRSLGRRHRGQSLQGRLHRADRPRRRQLPGLDPQRPRRPLRLERPAAPDRQRRHDLELAAIQREGLWREGRRRHRRPGRDRGRGPGRCRQPVVDHLPSRRHLHGQPRLYPRRTAYGGSATAPARPSWRPTPVSSDPRSTTRAPTACSSARATPATSRSRT